MRSKAKTESTTRGPWQRRWRRVAVYYDPTGDRHRRFRPQDRPRAGKPCFRPWSMRAGLSQALGQSTRRWDRGLRARAQLALASSRPSRLPPTRGCRTAHCATNEVGDWRDVLAELPRRIHEWMPRLAAEGVVGADAIFACLGPALESSAATAGSRNRTAMLSRSANTWSTSGPPSRTKPCR